MNIMVKISAGPTSTHRWSATTSGMRTEPASLVLMISISAVDAILNNMAREKNTENI